MRSVRAPAGGVTQPGDCQLGGTEDQAEPGGKGDGDDGNEEQTEDDDQAEHEADGLALLVRVGSRHGT